MRLPVLLQAWSPWLSLFPGELIEPLGRLLLRLAPLVGPLRRHAAPLAREPAGVGDIVRRGIYDRLLISEWAYADAAPDEFLRRAAGGELLFTGPEPANSEQSLRSVVLFDAGPAQLGEARLAHMAMFILLARRAAAAGAEFQWGVLQSPGTLHASTGEQALRQLLDARTWAVPDQHRLRDWNAALEGVGADCWLVGDADTPVPVPVRARVLVRRAWLGDELEVTLAQRRGSRTVTLALPRPEDSVRLLRHPFDAPPSPAVPMRVPDGVHSLKRAPMFGTQRGWLAANMLDGSVTVYHVPDSAHAKPGRARNAGPLPDLDTVVAAGLFHKSFGTVTIRQDSLFIAGFPGPFFQDVRHAATPLPDPASFQAVPGTLRWMPVFHLLERDARRVTEQVIVLDKGSRLVAWTRKGTPGAAPPETAFRPIAGKVIRATQFGNTLFFAVGLADRTDIYRLRSSKPVPDHVLALMHRGNSFFFGDLKGWDASVGIYALRMTTDDWLVGERKGATRITLNTNSVVLGAVRHPQDRQPGAVVLDRGRMRIALHTGDAALALVDAGESIVQASFDPLTGRLAWLAKNGTLTVQDIGSSQVLLRALPNRGNGHAG